MPNHAISQAQPNDAGPTAVKQTTAPIGDRIDDTFFGSLSATCAVMRSPRILSFYATAGGQISFKYRACKSCGRLTLSPNNNSVILIKIPQGALKLLNWTIAVLIEESQYPKAGIERKRGNKKCLRNWRVWLLLWQSLGLYRPQRLTLSQGSTARG